MPFTTEVLFGRPRLGAPQLPTRLPTRRSGRLRARRGAIDFPAGTAALIGVLIGVSLVVGAFGGYRMGAAMGQRSASDRMPPEGVVIGDSAGDDATACAAEPPARKTACIRGVLDHHIAKGGVASALTSLRLLAQTDPDIARDAHMYAHGIGIDAFQQRPDIDATFTHCTAEFSSGCYHGVLQAYFEMRGTADPKVVESACAPYESSPAKRWLLFQCLHGMGHGLDMALDHDLPHALKACDLLGERWHRDSCYGGVFMENITHVTVPDHPATLLAAQHGAHTDASDGMAGMHMGSDSHTALTGPRFQAIDSTNPQYPCSIVAEQYGRECYRIQTALMLYLNGGNMAKTAAECDAAPTQFRTQCYESLGRDIAAFSSYEVAGAVRLCSVGSRKLRKFCYAGAAETFVNEQAKPDAGFAICSTLPTVGDRPTCYERVGELVLSLGATPQDRERMCTLPSPTATRACRTGAQLLASLESREAESRK